MKFSDGDGTRLRVPSGVRLQCTLRSEASDPQQLEKLIGLQNEEPLIDSEMFVDSWIEEIFVWILVAFVHG